MIKKLLPVIILFCACSKDNTNNAPQNNNSSFNTEAAARKMFHHFNNHHWDSMALTYIDTAIFLDPALGDKPVKRTQPQIISHYTSLGQTVPDIHDSITNVFTNGNMAVIEFISTGTLPGGSKLYLPICTVLTFENGLIVKDATYYDN